MTVRIFLTSDSLASLPAWPAATAVGQRHWSRGGRPGPGPSSPAGGRDFSPRDPGHRSLGRPWAAGHRECGISAIPFRYAAGAEDESTFSRRSRFGPRGPEPARHLPALVDL